jgi:starvation-inducible DNA-binding protein
MDLVKARALGKSALTTPIDLETNAVRDIAGALNLLLADVFTLYVKTKNAPARAPSKP